jgi:hypothetical protein
MAKTAGVFGQELVCVMGGLPNMVNAIESAAPWAELARLYRENDVRWIYLGSVIFGLTATAPAAAQPASTKALDADALNARAASAPPFVRQSPVMLAHWLVGGDEETPKVAIEMTSDPKQDFQSARVTILRDGFLDDSVRGDWHRFAFARTADGALNIQRASVAWRCWRGATDAYQSNLCP